MKPYYLFSHEYPPFAGGVGNYSFGVAQAMHRAAIPVRVITFGEAVGTETSHLDKFPVFRIQTTRKAGTLRFMREFFEYVRFLRIHPTGTLHAMDWQSWKILSVLNLFRCVPYSLTLHGSEIHTARYSLRSRILGAKMLFRNVRHVTVNSGNTRGRLVKHFPFLSEKTVNIAYPAPQEQIVQYASLASKSTKAEEGLIRILTVARIEARKGHLFALEALRKLTKDGNIEIRWDIVGDVIEDGTYGQLRIAAESAPFPIRIHGKLGIDGLVELMKGAEIFLLSGIPHETKTEGFGMVYVEAGLFSLPSIGTLIGGVAEAVSHPNTGLLSPPGDIDQLTRNLKTLCEDGSLRQKMGTAASEYARSFSWEKTASSIFPELKDKIHG